MSKSRVRIPAGLRPVRFVMLAAVLVSGITAVTDAVAVGTRRIELTRAKDFKGGDLKGVAVDSAGRVRAGFSLGAVTVTDGTTVWSALARPDGSVLLGTGNEGKLVEVRGAKSKVLSETGSLVITSMVEAWDGAVVMGTLPDGELYKWHKGKLTQLVKLPDTEHIWDVAYDKASRSVFAATGPQGKLYRVDATGRAQVHFDAEEEHLMSVAVASTTEVYAGASDTAKLYKITGPGRAGVLHDFGRTEVRAIRIAKNGDVFAIANAIKSSRRAPTRKAGSGSAAPVKSGSKGKGKGILLRFSSDGTPEELYKDNSEHFTALELGADGLPYIGTGVEGRVYTVDAGHNSVLLADTEERQIGALLMRGKTHYVASSDPAVLHPVRSVGGADAVWTSKVLDAGLRAHFGRLSWEAQGKLDLSTRSGNSKEPDDTWSAWSPGLAAAGLIKSPAARYVQVRARFARDPKAVLSEVTIPFVTDNLRALVTSITTSSAGERGDGIKASGGPITDKAETKLSLKWMVENPDDDELRYRLQYRLVGTTHWYEMLAPRMKLTKKSFSWDTSGLPEGRYRVRVAASDELANPPKRVKKHELESDVVLVDNTAPSLSQLRVTGRIVRATATDGVGPIARFEISVAGTDEWYPYYPRDGVFDQQREELDADVAALAPQGRVMLAIRAYDQANNYVVRNITLK